MECLYKILLSVLARKDTKGFGTECEQVVEQLFGASGKKKDQHIISSGEDSIEIIVDLINLISVARLDLASQNIVLDLLKDKPSSEYPNHIH